MSEDLKEMQLSHATIEHAADAILWIDEAGRIRRANESACAYLGYEREHLIQKNIDEINPRYQKEAWKTFWERSQAQRALKYETTHYSRDGSEIPVEVTTNHLESDSQEYICLFVHDISERRRNEEKLREALKEVQRLKDRLTEENVYLQNEIKREHDFDEIICYGPALKRVLQKIEQVAGTDTTVLITGETGTGKELVARALHNISNRHTRALVKVNCAALPENLIESELFGHEKGAFTGAIQRKIGRFELADGGTIFLDEIGDLPLMLQSKLLRVLQEGEFERLGSSRTLTVNVRVIAATNRKLEQEITTGDFRKDLYYRLNVFPIEVPPLRERREDIPLLAKHFVIKSMEKTGRTITSIPQDTIDKMMLYPWPGNIRELENFIERAVILNTNGVLTMQGIPHCAMIHDAPPETMALEEVEKQHILKVLKSTSWRVSGDRGAATVLKLKPTTLEARMRRLGIKRPDKKSDIS